MATDSAEIRELMRYVAVCAKSERLWETLGITVDDGMFIRWAGRPVWVPVTEQSLLDNLAAHGANGDESARDYHRAYVAGKFADASLIWRRWQRKRWSPDGASRVRRSRAALSYGSHTAEEWHAVLALYKFRCAQCGKRGRLEKDHIVPLCAGGSNLAINLQPLCKSCNSAKSGRIAIGTQLGIFDRVTISDTKGQQIKRR